MSWPDYKMIVEISGDRGWTTHLFDNDWSDNIWPRSYIQGLVDNFIQLHEPPTRGMGKVALYKVDAERIEPSGWKVDAQPPGSWKRPNGIYKEALPDNVILIRVLGPMDMEMYRAACAQVAGWGIEHIELEITPVH